MLIVREVMYCKPGKVRPLVEKFLAMAKLSAKIGMPKMRVMTDVAAERYWTLVAEMEVPSMAEFERMMQGPPQNDPNAKEFENIMKGYHDLVEYGRREVYKVEG
jgi:isopentenyl diphosphate isomerase/L-lactate dehydrogenase-like FMN-dependent dehydrogenase